MLRQIRQIAFICLVIPNLVEATPGNLAGEWEFRFESQETHAAPDLCPQNGVWQKFRFPGQPPTNHRGKILWERSFIHPETWQPTLKFMSVDQFLEVYLGSTLIYAVGNPAEPGTAMTYGNTPHLVTIPPITKTTPLCFRVFSRTSNTGINGEVWLGTEKEILTLMVQQDLTRVILIALYLVCALALIAYYLLRSTEKGFLSWGLYILSFSIWLLTQTEIKQLLYADALIWRIIDYAALFQLPIWIALFLEHIFGHGWGKIMRWQRQAHTALACIIGSLIATHILPSEKGLVVIQVAIAIQLLTFMAVLLRHSLEGDHEARIFFGAAIAFALTGFHDILAGLTLLPWSMPISIWGTLLVLVAATAILMRRVHTLRHTDDKPPDNKSEIYPLFVILQTKFGLTYQQAQICAGVDEGLARGEISERLGIQANTLKIHLRSIYAKTVDRSVKSAQMNRDKLQRLTIFLQRLQQRH